MTNPNTSLYLPMPAAIEAGVLEVDAIKPHMPQDAARAVANGHMPDQAGLVRLPDGNLGAFDLVSVQGDDNERIIVSPLPKAVVAGSGLVVSSGQIILTTAETIHQPPSVRRVAETLPWRLAQWHDGFRRVGDIGIRHLFGTPALPVRDISDEGALLASSQRRYF